MVRTFFQIRLILNSSHFRKKLLIKNLLNFWWSFPSFTLFILYFPGNSAIMKFFHYEICDYNLYLQKVLAKFDCFDQILYLGFVTFHSMNWKSYSKMQTCMLLMSKIYMSWKIIQFLLPVSSHKFWINVKCLSIKFCKTFFLSK